MTCYCMPLVVAVCFLFLNSNADCSKSLKSVWSNVLDRPSHSVKELVNVDSAVSGCEDRWILSTRWPYSWPCWQGEVVGWCTISCRVSVYKDRNTKNKEKKNRKLFILTILWSYIYACSWPINSQPIGLNCLSGFDQLSCNPQKWGHSSKVSAF